MRHKSVNRKVTPVRENNKSQGWDLAIAQADKKIEALQSAKAAFEEYKERGDPFPSISAKQVAGGQVLGQSRDL